MALPATLACRAGGARATRTRRGIGAAQEAPYGGDRRGPTPHTGHTAAAAAS